MKTYEMQMNTKKLKQSLEQQEKLSLLEQEIRQVRALIPHI